VSNREIDRKVRHQAQSKPKFVQELPEESSGKNGDMVYFRNSDTNQVEQYLKNEGSWLNMQTGINIENAGASRRQALLFSPGVLSGGGTGGGGTGGGGFGEGDTGGGPKDPRGKSIGKTTFKPLTVSQARDRLTSSGDLSSELGGTVTGNLRITDGSLGVDIAASATDGRIDAANDVVAYSTSDKRLKENIKPLENALEKINQIRGVEFDWKELNEEERREIHGNQGHDVGVIAQEVEAILPEVVTERKNGYKAVKYEKIVPLLIEAVKELSNRIK